jgi:Tfp pilus assembly protein PilX
VNRLAPVRRRLADEQGQALVLAIAIIVIGLLLGLGAAAYALSANQQTVHDERNRSAQQAADAGVQRELYLNSDSDSVGYNLNSGLLGVGTFLDCTVPEVGVGATSLNLQVGTIQVGAGSAGVCPTSCTSVTTCTTGPPGKIGWQSLGNEAYYESEFLANAEPVANAGSAAGGNADEIEFPEIVTVGCHTTNAADPQTACLNGGAGNSYSRQLALLDPTAPLNAVEATNDVTINTSLTNLNQILEAQDITCTNVSVVGIGVVTECTVVNSDGLIGGVLATLQGLVGSVCGTVSVLTTGSNKSCVINELTTTVDGSVTGGVGVVDGNISAGNNLTLPTTTLDAQASSDTLPTSLPSSLGGVIRGVLGDVKNVVTSVKNPQTLSSTFSYGNSVCNEDTGTCGTENAGDTSPVTAVLPSFVKTSSTCQAGKPQTNCTVARPTFKVTSALTAASATNPAIPSGATLSSGGTASYVDGDLTLTSGTLTLAPGTYVFCGVYASGGTIANGPGGGVQIYVLPPPAAGQSPTSQCATQPTAGSVGYVQPGNFVSCNGVDNTLGDTSLSSLGTITGTINPSALQIYVAGNSVAGDGSTLSVGNTDTPVTICPNISRAVGSEAINTNSTPTVYSSTKDPATQVYIGQLSGEATASTIVYAPASEVTINAVAAYEGSAIGWNSDITAVSVLEDLDLGNYPISSVANAYQVSQTIQCDNSIEALSGTEVGNPVQNSSLGTPAGPASSGGVGDLNGCT